MIFLPENASFPCAGIPLARGQPCKTLHSRHHLSADRVRLLAWPHEQKLAARMMRIKRITAPAGEDHSVAQVATAAERGVWRLFEMEKHARAPADADNSDALALLTGSG